MRYGIFGTEKPGAGCLMAAHKRLTIEKDWGAAFLAHISRTGNVLRSAEAAGVTRQACYARRDTDPAFAAGWASAMEDAADVLEEIAWDRGRKQSDLLLIFLLRGLKPEKYRERFHQEITGPEGGPIRITEIVVETQGDEVE
jgi:hypothetical protein